MIKSLHPTKSGGIEVLWFAVYIFLPFSAFDVCLFACRRGVLAPAGSCSYSVAGQARHAATVRQMTLKDKGRVKSQNRVPKSLMPSQVLKVSKSDVIVLTRAPIGRQS